MKETLRIVWATFLAALILCGLLGLLCRWFDPWIDSIVTDSSTTVKQSEGVLANAQENKNVIILDPGHGGEDPGAIGSDGVLEKDLNLQVALRMRDLLEFSGYRVIMTRSDDRLLYDPDSSLSHKVQDLQTRLNYGDLYPTATFVSIHMNKFPDADCSGLQVYYSGNHASSVNIAEAIRSGYADALADGKARVCKPATSSIFILHRIKNPAVLIECGFLSNPQENERLQETKYQKKLTAVIVTALSENKVEI